MSGKPRFTAEEKAARAEARAAAFRADPTDPRHGNGTTNGYSNLDCRCERCTADHTRLFRLWMRADPDRLNKHRQREIARRQRFYDAGLTSNGKPRKTTNNESSTSS